jgi:hypothetical protein
MFSTGETFRLRFPAMYLAMAGLLAFSVWGGASTDKEAAIEELKARLVSVAPGDRPRLCLEIAERQLSSAKQFYGAGESEKGQAALSDVAIFCESARDNSIQTGKHLKQTEIAVRQMTRKLNDLKHTVTHDEQSAVQGTIDRLQRVRDDLLGAMFHKGEK